MDECREMEEILWKIAQGASAKIMHIYESAEVSVEFKDDDSPLTQADMDSHHHIVAALQAEFEWPVLSEESPVEFEERSSWEQFWLVDPLDGTKNFIARDGQFTINIGLVQGRQPKAGLVYVPAQGLGYFAAEGYGAWKISQTERVKVENTRHNQDDFICATSRFHDTSASADFCDYFGIDQRLKFGSALKLCKLAEGELDVYPRFVPTMEWDTAAAHCVLREANCKIIDLETEDELVYNKEVIRNNPFIASRNDLSFVEKWKEYLGDSTVCP